MRDGTGDICQLPVGGRSLLPVLGAGWRCGWAARRRPIAAGAAGERGSREAIAVICGKPCRCCVFL